MEPFIYFTELWEVDNFQSKDFFQSKEKMTFLLKRPDATTEKKENQETPIHTASI